MSEMATLNVPYLHIFRDRHGRERHYYRRRRYPTVALPDPSSPYFWAAYDKATAKAPIKAGEARSIPGSLSALIAAYYESAEWGALKASTTTGYRNMLDRFREVHGESQVKWFTTARLDKIFGDIALKTPGAATNLRKRLRRVFRLAVKMEWILANPVTETDAPRHRSGGFAPWSDDDCAAFEKHWPSGSRERRAYALLLWTGQRRSDVVGMGRQHVRSGFLHVTQRKTGIKLAIPVLPALAVELDATPANEMTYVLTMFGKPFSDAGFTSWFRERAEMAAVFGRTPHGLRKTAGRRLAEAGCTAKQIMAVLGHETMAEADRYTKDSDQRLLATQAMDRLAHAS
jgi:integrase